MAEKGAKRLSAQRIQDVRFHPFRRYAEPAPPAPAACCAVLKLQPTRINLFL
jgi:hypothetical protein